MTSSSTLKSTIAEFNTKDNVAITTGLEPQIVLSRCVLEKKTSQIIRHAAAELYLEGKSLSGQPRSMWNLMVKRDGYEYVLGLAYSAAVVSGADDIQSDWPEDIQELIQEMTHVRNDCVLRIIPLASQDPAHVRYVYKLLKDLNAEPPGRLLSKFRGENCRLITGMD